MIKNRVKELRMVSASALRPHPMNWRNHSPWQRKVLQEVLSEIGFAGAELVYQEGDDLVLIDGHLRREELGDQEIPVLVTDLTTDEASLLLATYDPLSAMAEMDAKQFGILSEGISTDNEVLRQFIDENTLKQDEEDAEEETEGLERKLRQLPKDFIYTFDNLTDITVLLAYDAGLKIGARSKKIILQNSERWEWRFKLTFIDNKYTLYDHALHLECVDRYRPKYATVRDIMTRKQ